VHLGLVIFMANEQPRQLSCGAAIDADVATIDLDANKGFV
jgi:hypothetical protein